jgi:hypothetical protein
VLGAITGLSLSPLPELPLPRPVASDKLHHFVAYGALAFPAALAGPRRLPWLLALFVGWGGAIEIIQPYVNRHGEWTDVAANAAGVATGALLGTTMRRIIMRPKRA